MRAHEHGFSLAEMLIVVAILAVAVASAAPSLKAYSEEARPLAAGQLFRGEFRKARSMAIASGAQTALRFEPGPGGMYFSIYRDANHNGVLSADIAAGRDPRVAGPFKLTGPELGVSAAIIENVPAIPPETGMLAPGSDPIRFGRAEMLSFSPLGTATPGTLYLAGRWRQTAVRVNGLSGRVRLMAYAGGRWRER
jgi:prepilin-type N-terminal cleavage/methylation domain-containing protein